MAALEFALLLPILLLLVLPITDFARAIQVHLILTNMAREGANLAVRGPYPLEQDHQKIIAALVESAPPLGKERLAERGMIYISRIVGRTSEGGTMNVVDAQFRWLKEVEGSSYQPFSRIWRCSGSWSNGRCASNELGTAAASVAIPVALKPGQTVFAVEVHYFFNRFFIYGGISPIGPDLYARVIF